MNSTHSSSLFLALAGLLAWGCSSGGDASQAADNVDTTGTTGSAGDQTSPGTGGDPGTGGSGSETAGSSSTGSGGSTGAGGMTSTKDAAVGPVVEAGPGGGDGASNGGWVSIWNGKDLTNWYPLITGFPYKTDPYNTFRADPATGVIKVTYENYPNGGSFDNHFGLLYYDKFLTNYRVRVEYHFLEPQAKNPPGWGKNNSGLMLFGIDPATVTGNPNFPPLIEIQLLGTPSAGGTNNANICRPGGMTVTTLFDKPATPGNCQDSLTGPAPPAAQWVTVEAEVHVKGTTKIYQYPDTTKPVLTFAGVTYAGKLVTGGYISIQSESQPCEFRKIELMELPE
jgi:hypothetical protein